MTVYFVVFSDKKRREIYLPEHFFPFPCFKHKASLNIDVMYVEVGVSLEFCKVFITFLISKLFTYCKSYGMNLESNVLYSYL